jgi:hypothetical protein
MSVGNEFNHLKLSYWEKTEKHQENEIMWKEEI